MIKNKIKELKLDPFQMKLLGYFLIFIVIGLYIFNYTILSKMEKDIKKFNGKEGAEGTAYESLKLKFDDVSCHGFFSAKTCVIEKPIVSVINKKNKQESYIFLKGDNLILDDIDFGKYKDISITAEVENIQFGKEYFKRLTMDIANEKKSKAVLERILKKTLPINISLDLKLKYLGLNKFKKYEYEGPVSIKVESKILDFTGEGLMVVSEGRGKIITFQKEVALNDNPEDNVITEISTGKENFSLMKYFNVKINIKDDFNSYLYDLYLLKLMNLPYDYQRMMNTSYFGIPEERLLTKSEFKTILLKRLKEASTEGRNDLEKEYYKTLSEMWSNKKNEMVIKYKNKSGITLEEMQMMNELQKVLSPMELELNHFDTKIESNLRLF